jgi:hypothetical protein
VDAGAIWNYAKLKRATLLACAIALCLAIGEARQASTDSSLGVDFTSTPGDLGQSTWYLGFEFQAVSNSTVVALGNVDVTGNGYSQAQQIGL